MNLVLMLLAGCPSPEPAVVAPEPAVVAEPVVVVGEPVVEPVVEPAVVPPGPVAPEPVVPAAPATPASPKPPPVVVAPEPAPVAGPEPAPAPSPVATAADYTLVPGKNALFVVVKYERGTLGANLAHDHAIVATTYSGTVHWDPANPGACQIAVDVPTSGLRVDPPGARARAGLEGEASADDHPKIEANFNGSKQLDSARFPVLKFRSTGCTAADPGTWNVSGALTIHGVARPTTAKMKITVDGDRLTATGTFGAKHGDFGMSTFTAAMGAVRNAEPLTFVLDLAGTRN